MTDPPARKMVDWWRKDQDLHNLTLFCLAEVIFGFALLGWQVPTEKGTAILWGSACFGVGLLGGFLFGIPKPRAAKRRSQSLHTTARLQPGGMPPERVDRSRYRVTDVNTNLGEISDWLTKTIVGVGMVELKAIPGLLDRLTRSIADGVPSARSGAKSLALAIVCYFAVFGFIHGYLYTRLFAAPAFRKVDGPLDEPLSVG